MMLVQFSMVPVGTGSSLSRKVASVVRIVQRSGLPYRVTPMATVVEGDWDRIFDLIKRCQAVMMRGEERVVTTITIDDRKGRKNAMEGKIASLERHLGRPLGKSGKTKRRQAIS